MTKVFCGLWSQWSATILKLIFKPVVCEGLRICTWKFTLQRRLLVVYV